MKLVNTLTAFLATASAADSSAADNQPLARWGERGAFVHLFEWGWNDIARECEDYLQPLGYTAVQVSPPNEHRSGSEWWTRYQPVSYNLTSRSGSMGEFQSMVDRCTAVGVNIYVDAVINHMAAGNGVGNAGSSFGDRDYPGTYGPQDFHNQGNPSTNCQINNYNDRFQVQNCDLLGLPDLATGQNYVQDRLARYMNDLYAMGVVGVRIDAAKHIDAGQLANIMSRVNSNMYVFTEVIDGPGEPITPSEYFGIGDVTEFNFGRRLKDIFGNGNLGDLRNFGEAFGLMPSNLAVTFIENHDTEREYPWNYKNGRNYEISVVFALAHPYGYPKVMSGYNFDDFDQGPPSSGAYDGCFNQWTCQHRWSPIANMVGFRNAAIGQGVDNFYSESRDRISFSRGNVAFVAFNRNNGAWSTCRQTGLPAGSYRNVIETQGEMIQVQGDGTACFSVPNFRAVAFYVGA